VTAVSDIEAALNDLPRDGVRLLDIVTDPDLISPTTRLSEITQSTRSQNV
jgi:Asp-tRNA(Asn)/Glu-tRNA(Gln) amidotransferase B subunit